MPKNRRRMEMKTFKKITYQWTKARLRYIRSNLWSRRAHNEAIAVVLLNMQTARLTGAISLPSVACRVWLLMPTLNPVGHQSTKWMFALALILEMASLTFLGATSPRYSKQQDMYLPALGSHFTIWFWGSNTACVISLTFRSDFWALTLERIGAKLARGKWIRG